jgi:Ca2+-binding EF-hand superfamily protein
MRPCIPHTKQTGWHENDLTGLQAWQLAVDLGVAVDPARFDKFFGQLCRADGLVDAAGCGRLVQFLQSSVVNAHPLPEAAPEEADKPLPPLPTMAERGSPEARATADFKWLKPPPPELRRQIDHVVDVLAKKFDRGLLAELVRNIREEAPEAQLEQLERIAQANDLEIPPAPGQLRVWTGAPPRDLRGRLQSSRHYDTMHRHLLQLAFTKFDKDGDGELDPEEVLLMMNELGYNMSNMTQQALVQQVFEEEDTDGDGVIIFEEFEHVFDALIKHMRGGVAETEASRILSQRQLLQLAFHKFDKDGDGELEPAEVLLMMSELGYNMSEHGQQRLVHDLFAEHDSDGNGVIDFEEFEAVFMSLSTLLTAGSNSTLTMRQEDRDSSASKLRGIEALAELNSGNTSTRERRPGDLSAKSRSRSRTQLVEQLSGLKPSQLQKRALAAGVSEEELEEALDSANPKAAVMALVVSSTLGAESVAASSTSNQEQLAAARQKLAEHESGAMASWGADALGPAPGSPDPPAPSLPEEDALQRMLYGEDSLAAKDVATAQARQDAAQQQQQTEAARVEAAAKIDLDARSREADEALNALLYGKAPATELVLPSAAVTVTATAPRVAEHPGDLAFATGDVVVVTDDTDTAPGWWKGYKQSDANKAVGVFPHNHTVANCKIGASVVAKESFDGPEPSATRLCLAARSCHRADRPPFVRRRSEL